MKTRLQTAAQPESEAVIKQAEFAAARRRMARRSIPELIELLGSPDLRTRFLAEMCLRDATDT
ncbi:MAG TPA: hypothetical protein VGB73_07295 [Pyrinomonadaceae bacterium]